MIKRKWFEILVIVLFAAIVLIATVIIRPDQVVGDTESELISEETEELPPEIVEVPSEPVKQGTEEETEVTEETEEPTYISLGVAQVTAYCKCYECCGRWSIDRPVDENGNEIVYGASGAELIPYYSIAVDPDVIPYGTKVYIDGREFIAHDSGKSIDGNDIDLYLATHEETVQWGVREYEIFIEKVE